MATPSKISRTRLKYGFIKAHSKKYPVQTMCKVLDVAPSGYYAWLQQPISDRAQEDIRLLHLIRASYKASHGIYGAPRIFLDLREAGETCSKPSIASNGSCVKTRLWPCMATVTATQCALTIRRLTDPAADAEAATEPSS